MTCQQSRWLVRIKLSKFRICGFYDFNSVLMTATTPAQGKRPESDEEKWLPCVVVAAVMVLKQHCQDMNAVQLMVTTLIKYTGFHMHGI